MHNDQLFCCQSQLASGLVIMGNQSSSGGGQRSLKSAGPPRREDYKAYVDDLLELQKFLDDKFIAGSHLRSSVRDDDQFDTEYLDALRIKLEQLRNVRRHVRNLPTTLTRLLDALEPQCQRAIDQLTQLQADRCPMTSSAAGVAPVQSVTVSQENPRTPASVQTSVNTSDGRPITVKITTPNES